MGAADAPRCPRCSGVTYTNVDGDRVCIVCGAVLYKKQGLHAEGEG